MNIKLWWEDFRYSIWPPVIALLVFSAALATLIVGPHQTWRDMQALAGVLFAAMFLAAWLLCVWLSKRAEKQMFAALEDTPCERCGKPFKRGPAPMPGAKGWRDPHPPDCA